MNDALKIDIRASKKACFEDLCQNANTNPRIDAYRVVMTKTGGTEPFPETLKKIIEEFDLSLGPLFVEPLKTRAGYEERITDEELAEISKSLSVDKAGGPDRAPNLTVKAAFQRNPSCLGLSR